MRKTICIWIGAIGFCIVSFFVQRAYFAQIRKESDNSVLQEISLEGRVSSQEMLVEEPAFPRETMLETSAFSQEIFDEDGIVRDIFTDNGIVDLGNNCIAYPVPNDEVIKSIFGYDDNFTGHRYIAVCAIDFDKSLYTDGDTYYLPDTYGNIAEMKMDESGELYLRYQNQTHVSWETAEVRIPFYFSARITEPFFDMDEWASYDPYKKQILATQQGLMSGEEDAFPQTVWTEAFRMGEESYEAVLERVSPFYDFFPEHNWNVANYRLTVKSESGNIVSKHMILNHSARYEEPHWLVDFTKDGYLDMALCADIRGGESYGLIIYYGMESRDKFLRKK